MRCKKRNNYSYEQRLIFYPFSEAKSVSLISFRQPDSIVMGGKVPLKKGALDSSLVEEMLVLSKIQIDSLTHILYNIGYKGYFFTEFDHKCYNPRNAIVFYGVSGKLLGYMELCFECQKYRLSSKKIKTGDFCEEKYEMLRVFFLEAGIKYGTKLRVEEEEEG